MNHKEMSGLMSLSLYEVCDILFDKRERNKTDKEEVQLEFNDIVFKVICQKK